MPFLLSRIIRAINSLDFLYLWFQSEPVGFSDQFLNFQCLDSIDYIMLLHKFVKTAAFTAAKKGSGID